MTFDRFLPLLFSLAWLVLLFAVSSAEWSIAALICSQVWLAVGWLSTIMRKE